MKASINPMVQPDEKNITCSRLSLHIQKFLSYIAVIKHASPHTVRNYGLDLKAFESFSPNLDLFDLNKKVFRSYLAELNQKGSTKRTILRHLSSLKAFFKYLIKEKIIEHHPLDGIRGPKLEKKIPSTLVYKQIEHLFAQPDTREFLGFRDRCIMELFYSSGLRISELANLNRRDLDDQSFTMRIKGKGKSASFR
jgi:integrase/recombinase XerC